MNFLSAMLADVKADVVLRAKTKPITPAIISRAPRRSLVRAIEQSADVPVIAEIKRSSPSAGSIRPGADPAEMAASMLRGGAIALSVLTEPRHFSGDPNFLREIKKVARVPLLYKGFVVDDYQIYEAAMVGADAVLLIVKALKEELPKFMALAARFGMESLVEVTDEAEAALAKKAEAKLIGINNRNLETLEVNLARTEKLAPLIPQEATLVSESGIKSPADVKRMLKAGADAVLIGTAIMREGDVEAKVRSLVEAR